MITFSKFGRKGRLGNQLFQYAAMIGMAKKYKQLLAMPPWVYARYFKEYPFQAEVKGMHITEPSFHWTPDFFDKIDFTGNVDFDGYFQSEKYFLHARNAVLECLEFKDEFVKKVADKYKSALSKKTIAISIRRGDYVLNQNYFQLSITYYFTALLKHFPAWEAFNIVIFSDDINYCKTHFESFKNVFYAENTSDNLNLDSNKYFQENYSAIEQLCLMAMCSNFIIANSTFSWWGAWLGCNWWGDDEKVVRPKELFSGNLAKNSIKDFYPQRWIIHENERIDLTDVTFMIPVSFDHNDRKQNLSLNVCMLQKYFDTNIIIGEQGSSVFLNYIEFGCTHLHFTQMKEFHRTKMLNKMAERAETRIIVNWDADVFISPLQIYNSVEMLRKGHADVVYPYDGRFARVHRVPHFKSLEKHLDVGIFGGIEFKGMKPDDKRSVGGAILFNRDKYFEGGGENENFVAYGPEDVEREVRFTRLGYKVKRTSGVLYHLDHYKGPNSMCSGNPYDKQNHNELDKIYSFNQKQLREYVDKHLKK